MTSTTPTPGALYVVGGRPYIDSQTLHNLTQVYTVSPVEDGWKVTGPGGDAVLCLGTACPPLPGQRGSLYEARAVGGTKLADACALWLARGAAQLAGKHNTWPTAEGCGCGVSCGCGPCRSRHPQVRASVDRPDTPMRDAKAADVVSSDEVEHTVLDYLAQKLPGFEAETERIRPLGFRIRLYHREADRRKLLLTVEVKERNTDEYFWETSLDETTRETIKAAIDGAIDRTVKSMARAADRAVNAEPPAHTSTQHVATRISDEQAAQYVLDVAPFEIRGYMPETEGREPSGFFLHLYLEDEGDERKAVTFEVESTSTMRITWFVQPASVTRRSAIVRTVDLLIQNAYNEESYRD